METEEQKRKKWLRRHLPARPIQGFLDDISCALRAIGDRILAQGDPQMEHGNRTEVEAGGKTETTDGTDSKQPATKAEVGAQTRVDEPGVEKQKSGPSPKKNDGENDREEEDEDKHRPHHLVWSDEFAKAVRRAGVKVVVLSTCESAWRDHEDFSWSGVAAALLRAGIPVVVGMQFTISDSAAIAFSGAFYRAIARGLSVDEAVGHGRAAMTDEALSDLDNGLAAGEVPDPNGEADNFLSDFGLPVLYTRSPQVQSLDKIRDVDTDPLPMTDRFRRWNPGFEVFVGPKRIRR